jgi:hypothetical protein
VLLDDHVADVDAHAKLDALLRRRACIPLGHPALDLDGAANAIHNARELGKEAVAGVLDDTPAVLGDLRVHQFPEMRL